MLIHLRARGGHPSHSASQTSEALTVAYGPGECPKGPDTWS